LKIHKKSFDFTFNAGEKQSAILNVERLIEETRELLEQMELEIREVPANSRQKYQTRLRSYKTELTNLEKELRRARIAFSDEVHTREELLGEDSISSEDQRARLLDNTDRIERQGKRLEQGYKTVLETERIGADVLSDLHSQRETIQRSRQRLRETNENLGKSSRTLSGMMRRIVQNRILLVVLAITMVFVIGVAIYFATKKS